MAGSDDRYMFNFLKKCLNLFSNVVISFYIFTISVCENIKWYNHIGKKCMFLFKYLFLEFQVEVYDPFSIEFCIQCKVWMKVHFCLWKSSYLRLFVEKTILAPVYLPLYLCQKSVVHICLNLCLHSILFHDLFFGLDAITTLF